MLSSEQIKTLSAILADLGQVSIASVVIPFVIPTFSENALATIISGTLVAILLWTLSILFVKNT